MCHTAIYIIRTQSDLAVGNPRTQGPKKVQIEKTDKI